MLVLSRRGCLKSAGLRVVLFLFGNSLGSCRLSCHGIGVGRATARILFGAALCTLLGIGAAAAQSTQVQGCASEPAANAAQTLRCAGGVTIVAEDGAQFKLDRDRNGVVYSVALSSKAVLLDAPKQTARSRFEVVTPQAIAAVRGTKWAVDTNGTTTSVLVLRGQVAVRRHAGRDRAVLGPGEGVDVEAGTAPLTVKRWPQPRVAALLARLGQ
jgi:ferric-dicitrate binding protein FerR (iron transport regulator)